MEKTISKSVSVNIIILFLFLAASIIFTFPLIVDLETKIPGDFPVDPPNFVWNYWNFKDAINHPPHNPFIAHKLLYPFEPSTILHANTTFRNVIVILLADFIKPIAAFNIVTFLMFCFSGFGGYLLTLRFTHNRYAAFMSGIIFSFCSDKLARLSGHYNLTDTVFIPFYVLSLFKTFETKKKGYAILSGILLALTGYCCYYYLVFLILFTIFFVAFYFFPSLRPSIINTNFIKKKEFREKESNVLTNINYLLGIPAALVSLFVIFIGPIYPPPFSVRSATRPMLILLLLFLVNWCARHRFNFFGWFKAIGNDLRKLWTGGEIKIFSILIGFFLIFFSPVIINLLEEYSEYPSEISTVTDYPRVGDFFSPQGRGNATLNKILFKTPGNHIERRVYLGIIPLILCIIAAKRIKKDKNLMFWFYTGAGFLIFSMGPSLRVGERGLFWLPYNIIQAFPFLRGAREPSRYLIFGMLALGILTAASIDWIFKKIRNLRASFILIPALAFFIFAATSIDYITVPNEMVDLSAPDIYHRIGDDQENYSILEIPFNIQGKGREMGGVNSHYGLYQFYQSIHHKNLLSGYLVYIPYKITEYFKSITIINSICQLQNNDISNDVKRNIWKKPYSLDGSNLFYLLDIRYIIIHKIDLSKYSLYYVRKYLKKHLGDRLREVQDDSDLLVYKTVQPTENPFYGQNLIDDGFSMNFLEGWSPLQNTGEKRFRYLTGKEGRLAFRVSNIADHSIEINLMGARLKDEPIELQVFLNNKELESVNPIINIEKTEPNIVRFIVQSKKLSKGLNILGFRFNPVFKNDKSPGFTSIVINPAK